MIAPGVQLEPSPSSNTEKSYSGPSPTECQKTADHGHLVFLLASGCSPSSFPYSSPGTCPCWFWSRPSCWCHLLDGGAHVDPRPLRFPGCWTEGRMMTPHASPPHHRLPAGVQRGVAAAGWWRVEAVLRLGRPARVRPDRPVRAHPAEAGRGQHVPRRVHRARRLRRVSVQAGVPATRLHAPLQHHTGRCSLSGREEGCRAAVHGGWTQPGAGCGTLVKRTLLRVALDGLVIEVEGSYEITDRPCAGVLTYWRSTGQPFVIQVCDGSPSSVPH